MKCASCGAADVKVTNEAYKYDECGLPNVTLLNVEIRRCRTCGEEIAVIPRIAELHGVLARAVVEHQSRFSGAQVRFLRKYLGYSGADFSEIVGVSRETLSRWENDKETIGPVADRLLRLLVVQEKRVQDYNAAQSLRNIANEVCVNRLSVTREGKTWLAQPAA